MDEDLPVSPEPAQRPGPRTPARPPSREPAPTRPLGDDDLADEIELYGAVVVAASTKDGELSAAEIDDALGVLPARDD